RPLQVAPQLLAVLIGLEQLAVDGVDGQPLALGLDDTDDAVAGHGAAAAGEVQGDARRQSAAADVEPRPFAALDAPLGGGGLALREVEAGEDDIQHLGRRDPAAAEGLEQLVLAGRREALQRRAKGDLAALLAGPLEGLVEAGAAETDELLLLGLADVTA